MATYYWRGSAGANSAVTGNWNTNPDGSGSNPSSTDFNNDTLIFDGTVDNDCNFNTTVVEILKIQSGYSGTVTFANDVSIDDHFEFNGKITASSARVITFTNGAKTHPVLLTVEFGSSASYGGSGRANLTWHFDVAGDRVVYFQNGEYPNVVCDDAMTTATNPGFSPESIAEQYDNVNSNFPYVDFYSLTVNNDAVWGAVESSDLGHPNARDYDKTFRIGSKGSSPLSISAPTWDMGKAKIILVARNGTSVTFPIPHSGNSFYNSGDFNSHIRHLELEKYTTQVGLFAVQDRSILELEGLTIGSYCMLTGPTAIDAIGSEIRLVNKPKIRGSWSFGQKADGIYLSPISGSKSAKSDRIGIGNIAPTASLDITSPDTRDAVRVVITDTDSSADSTPFVIDEVGHVGIGTANPHSGSALTLNGDGTTYEGIMLQVGGSNKFRLMQDGAKFYLDSQVNNYDAVVRLRNNSGTQKSATFTTDNGGVMQLTGVEEVICLACSDETSDLTTGTAKVTFHMPYAMTLTSVKATCSTAPVGSTIIVDINEGGSTILSTKLSIDASELTSSSAASAAVISDTSLADDAVISVDIDQIGSSTAGKGLKVWLIGFRT